MLTNEHTALITVCW